MTEPTKKIAVHSGSFHADDCLAYAIILEIIPENELVRTRDPDELVACDIRIDVGCCYNGETDFDHHQREFSESRNWGEKVKYASAGLVWKKYGEAYIAKIAPDFADKPEKLAAIKDKVDRSLVVYVDADDNGIKLIDNSLPSISKAIFMLNAAYGTQDKNNFIKASSFMGDILKGFVLHEAKFARDEDAVMKALLSSKDKSILKLPGKSSFPDVVAAHWDDFKDVKVAVYPDSDGRGWRIQSLVARQDDRFSNRCKAPEKWRGLGDEALAEICGVANAGFIHPSGFTGGAADEKSVLKLAKIWVEQSPGEN